MVIAINSWYSVNPSLIRHDGDDKKKQKGKVKKHGESCYWPH